MQGIIKFFEEYLGVMSKQRKAVALISGGLDSLLAAKTIMEQGIHVEGINFFTGFCVEGHTHAIRKKDKAKPKRNNALWSAEQLGIKLHIIDVIDEYIESDVSLRTDMRATKEFRLHLCKTLAKRALKKTLIDNGVTVEI